MKKIQKIFIIFLAVLTLGSCKKDWLDVNTDPNNPATASPELALSAGQLSAAVNINTDWNICTSMWAQFWTQSNTANQYNNYDAYNVTNSNFGRQWTEAYAGGLNDLKYVSEKAEEEENWALFLMSEVMTAYIYQNLVDLYDDVPYSEALMGAENLEPEEDNGQDIYDDLISRIDAALAKDYTSLGPANIDPSGNDMIFGGASNIENWVRFANTLKLRLLLRQVNVRPTVTTDGINALINDGAEFLTTDAALTDFKDEANFSNPLYENDHRQLNTNNNIRASATMVTYLQSNSDGRDLAMYESVSATSIEINGLEQGGHIYTTVQVDPSTISEANIQATDPVFLLSAEESYFLQAEAYLRVGNIPAAQAAYETGVMASFNRAGIDGSSFIATAGAYEFPATGTFDEQLEAIMMQKWVALGVTKNGIEAYNDIKRTGYPRQSSVPITDDTYVPGELTRPLESVLNGFTYPKRFVYPQTYTQRNSNAPEAVAVTVPVWWE
jgi:hypothetical protein